MEDSLADDFRTALTLKVPTFSEGHLSESDLGDSDCSSRGGSERGALPKISIMRLGDENGTARTTHDSRSVVSYSNEDERLHGAATVSVSSLDGDISSCPSGIRNVASSINDGNDSEEEEKKEYL